MTRKVMDGERGTMERGGGSSITPPATLHGSASGRSYGGLDTLDVGFGVVWTDAQWARVCSILDEAKAAAAAGGELADSLLRFAGLEWRVRPSGVVAGSGQGPYYAWVLEADGLVVQIMRRQVAAGHLPNVRIHAGAMACLDAGGMAGIARRLRSVARRLGGGLVEWDKVSRADLFVDLADAPIEDLVASWNADRVITRARRAEEYGVFREGRKATGLRIGAGRLMFRAYDKVRELEHHSLKRAAWEVHEWSGDPPAVCTRCEYQLRREALKSFGVDSLADLVSLLRRSIEANTEP